MLAQKWKNLKKVQLFRVCNINFAHAGRLSAQIVRHWRNLLSQPFFESVQTFCNLFERAGKT